MPQDMTSPSAEATARLLNLKHGKEGGRDRESTLLEELRFERRRFVDAAAVWREEARHLNGRALRTMRL